MECQFDGGKHADVVIIRDPYLFPAAHGVKLMGLWSSAAVSGILAVVVMSMMWVPWCQFTMKDRLKIKICFWYLFLTSCGSGLEALATSVLSESDGFALILIARMVTITSLGPLLASANGMGETIWPSKRWQDVWIVSIIFLLASLAGFLTLSLMLRDFGLLALGCTMALGFFYTAVVWLLALRKVAFRGFGSGTPGPCTMFLLLGSYIFLGLTDLTCGAPGHVDCYARCFLGQGGMHYMFWMAVVGVATMFLSLYFLEDEPQARMQWPKILTFRMLPRTAGTVEAQSVPPMEPSANSTVA